MFAEYIDWRAEHPSDDIMTQLLQAEFEDETGATRRLTRNEILTYVNVIAGAGNETTTRLIGWAGKVLADHPDQRRALVDDPTLIPGAVEELLRYEPPPPHVGRCTASDVEFHGETIPAGSAVLCLVGAANRDDRRFPNGDTFDIRRDDGSHLAFGFGPHFCLGAALARLEGRVALEELLRRFPAWDVDLDGRKARVDLDGAGLGGPPRRRLRHELTPAAELNGGAMTQILDPELFLPEPEPAVVKYTVISVDDHLVEPRDMFERRLPTKLQERAPKVVTNDAGHEVWEFEGHSHYQSGMNAVAGRRPSSHGMEPFRFSEMRPSCYDPHARVHDMDLGGSLGGGEFPVDDHRLLRPGLLERAGPRARSGDHPRLQRLDGRGVVAAASRPVHPRSASPSSPIPTRPPPRSAATPPAASSP